MACSYEGRQCENWRTKSGAPAESARRHVAIQKLPRDQVHSGLFVWGEAVRKLANPERCPAESARRHVGLWSPRNAPESSRLTLLYLGSWKTECVWGTPPPKLPQHTGSSKTHTQCCTITMDTSMRPRWMVFLSARVCPVAVFSLFVRRQGVGGLTLTFARVLISSTYRWARLATHRNNGPQIVSSPCAHAHFGRFATECVSSPRDWV